MIVVKVGIAGVLGIAPPFSSEWSAPSPLLALATANGLEPSIAICLRAAGGLLVLGYDEHVDGGGGSGVAGGGGGSDRVEWLPSQSQRHWSVALVSIAVGRSAASATALPGIDAAILNGHEGALVDSGTTLVMLPSTIYSALRSALEAACSRGVALLGVCGTGGRGFFDGFCVAMDAAAVAQYPSLYFTAQGEDGAVQLEWPPSQYLYVRGAYRCLGFRSASNEAVHGGVVLGASFLTERLFIMDYSNLRLGFGSCPL